MFKIGDLVVGKPGNIYSITTENSICRINSEGSGDVDVIVEAHLTKQKEIGNKFTVDLRQFHRATEEDFVRFGLFDKIKRRPVYIRL